MATITSKTLASTVQLTDELPINRGGSDFKVNWQSMINYLDNATAYGVSIQQNNIFRTTTVPATYMPFTGGAFVGLVSGLTPTLPEHLVRKDYVDTANALKVNRAGDVMTGPLLCWGIPPNNGNEFTPKNYVDGLIATCLKVATDTDCAANPNYPSALAGTTLKVSVAGKIGGASGLDVEVGHLIVCQVGTIAGDQAAVGANWFILDRHRVTATDTTEGVVRKATAQEAIDLDGAGAYPDSVQMATMFSAYNQVLSSASPTYTFVASNNYMNVTLLSQRSLLSSSTVTLPIVSALAHFNWVRITIKDTGGQAFTNNITVQGQSGANIDNATTFIMNNNYQAITVVTDGTNWFIV